MLADQLIYIFFILLSVNPCAGSPQLDKEIPADIIEREMLQTPSTNTAALVLTTISPDNKGENEKINFTTVSSITPL